MMNYDIFISSHLAKLAHKACFRVGNLDAAHSEGVVSEGVSERVRDRQTTRQKKKTRRYRPPLSLSLSFSLSQLCPIDRRCPFLGMVLSS